MTLVNIERRVRPDLKTTLMLNFLQTRLMSSLIPATQGITTSGSFSLALLSLITATRVCCFLHRWGRSIVDKVCRVTILLQDSSEVVNFLLKVVLCANDLSGPVVEASSGRAQLKNSYTISMGSGRPSSSRWSRKRMGHSHSLTRYSGGERMAAWTSLSTGSPHTRTGIFTSSPTIRPT